MKALRLTIGAVSILAAANTAAIAQESGSAIPVTIDNFKRAESDFYFGVAVKHAGGIGKVFHYREPMEIEHQTVIRGNRDTLYSSGVFDLDAGPVTITMPNAGRRFMSMHNEDHYVPAVYYGAGSHVLTRQNVGTRYVLVGIRTLVDPNDPNDLRQVHTLQDAIKVSQKSAGELELPDWDQTSQREIRSALLVLAKNSEGFARAFGSKDQVDPVRHLIE